MRLRNAATIAKIPKEKREKYNIVPSNPLSSLNKGVFNRS
jgi:hypothetical protein